MLAEGQRTATEIHRAFPIANPAVSRHLRMLRKSAWSASGGSTRTSGCASTPSSRSRAESSRRGSTRSAGCGSCSWIRSRTNRARRGRPVHRGRRPRDRDRPRGRARQRLGAGERVSLTWTQVGWPEGVSTDIDATFEPVGEGTLVRLEQTGFERLGPEAAQFIAGDQSGWNTVLGWFAERVEPGREGSWRRRTRVLFMVSRIQIRRRAACHQDGGQQAADLVLLRRQGRAVQRARRALAATRGELRPGPALRRTRRAVRRGQRQPARHAPALHPRGPRGHRHPPGRGQRGRNVPSRRQEADGTGPRVPGVRRPLWGTASAHRASPSAVARLAVKGASNAGRRPSAYGFGARLTPLMGAGAGRASASAAEAYPAEGLGAHVERRTGARATRRQRRRREQCGKRPSHL
jgi:hypothetical protein